MDIETIIILFLAFIIIGALIAIETPNLISAVICLGTVHIGFTILFLFMRAPDLAITHMVVEVVCLVILIRATLSRDKSQVGERSFFGQMATIAIVGILFMLCLKVVPFLGDFGYPVFARVENAPSATYLAEGLKDTGAANAVASVILDYRGYDTLGEATILFASIIGAAVLVRRRPRKKVEEADTI